MCLVYDFGFFAELLFSKNEQQPKDLKEGGGKHTKKILTYLLAPPQP